jgi:glycosyltransferase involved in cell wall biosynthesis
MLVNITIPVFNEEVQLRDSVLRLNRFLQGIKDCRFEIVVADNGSTDRTAEIAEQLSRKLDSVQVTRLNQKGRGAAVKKVWLESSADILSYMDVDLSSDIHAFPDLIEPLISGQFDLAVASRRLRPELTTRSWKREFISRSYNWLVKLVFQTSFSDAQCGFKAISRQAAQDLLPLVEDKKWFMDTELLVLAEKLGYRIFDMPVRWIDDPDTRVKLIRTAVDDLKGMILLRRKLAKLNLSSGQQHRFRPLENELRESRQPKKNESADHPVEIPAAERTL